MEKICETLKYRDTRSVSSTLTSGSFQELEL